MSILGETQPWYAPAIINVAKNGTNSFGYTFYEKSRSFVTYEMRLDSIQSFLRTWGLPKPPPGYDRVKIGRLEVQGEYCRAISTLSIEQRHAN